MVGRALPSPAPSGPPPPKGEAGGVGKSRALPLEGEADKAAMRWRAIWAKRAVVGMRKGVWTLRRLDSCVVSGRTSDTLSAFRASSPEGKAFWRIAAASAGCWSAQVSARASRRMGASPSQVAWVQRPRRALTASKRRPQLVEVMVLRWRPRRKVWAAYSWAVQRWRRSTAMLRRSVSCGAFGRTSDTLSALRAPSPEGKAF